MRCIKKTLLLSALLCFGALATHAQDEEDMDYRNKSKSKEPVNTDRAVADKAIEKIVGTWQIEDVMNGNRNLVGRDTLQSAETFVFSRENRYVSYSDNEKIDSGMFRLNENHSILYLESESGGVPREWEVMFDGEQMTMQPRQQTTKTKPIKFVYLKREGNEQ